MLFMKCYRYFHIVIPRQELPWVIPFLPTNMPQLRIHDFDIPQAEEVCTRDSILKNRGTAWGFWKDIGQMVNLYADNFTAGADYIMQIDSDTVFNYPVRHPAALFGSKGPHLFHWQVEVPAPWYETSSQTVGGPVNMHFMAKFPNWATAPILQKVRGEIMKQTKEPTYLGMAELFATKTFSQFDLIGRAFATSGPSEIVHPCPAGTTISTSLKCAAFPHPMTHVTYPDKVIHQNLPMERHKVTRKTSLYGMVTADIIAAGWCFGQTSEDGVAHPVCRKYGLGYDVHPRSYDYLGEGVPRGHVPTVTQGHKKQAHWAEPLKLWNTQYELVLPWSLEGVDGVYRPPQPKVQPPSVVEPKVQPQSVPQPKVQPQSVSEPKMQTQGFNTYPGFCPWPSRGPGYVFRPCQVHEGGRCEVSCAPGYRPVGLLTATCKAAPVWEHTGYCEKIEGCQNGPKCLDQSYWQAPTWNILQATGRLPQEACANYYGSSGQYCLQDKANSKDDRCCLDYCGECSGPDCDAAEGRVENIMCPYLSILMEHCYHCYNPNTTTGEVVVCEGWSEEDIRAQCESPEPLSAPSPSPVSSL
jgi:hypothetical protein